MKTIILKCEVPDDFDDNVITNGWYNHWLTEFKSEIVTLPTEVEIRDQAESYAKPKDAELVEIECRIVKTIEP